ncbi:MAG: NADPH:quinone reductase [Alphaproteobacteria bacterium]|nr:NADPH:quinone reductase [Alphaproteobacteria bacterium]
MKAIRFAETGGPEVLRLEDVEIAAPGAGQVRIRHEAIGVNFIDTYHRTGLYPLGLPSGLGMEAAGVVEAVGEGVTRFAVGDRAGYCSGPIGAYAEAQNVPADRAVKLPEGVSFDIAAAAMLKGMTARYLLRKTFPLQRGQVCVIHAAAGGVGQIAVQWAKHLGAGVIAVVGSDAKAEIARGLGADHTIVSTREQIAPRVREITGGEGADVVYDSVGKDTFDASLDSLKPLGMFVSFGNASGAAPPFAPGILSAKGSLFFTRPTLMHYTRTPALLQETADDLWGVMASGAVTVAAPAQYKLADAAQAHRDLEARKTTGSVVLAP